MRRGIWHEHGVVAVKTLAMSSSVTSIDESANTLSVLDEFCREATVISSMRHRNVVRLHGVVLAPLTLALVTELCEGGTLDAFIRESTVADVPWPLVHVIALDVARALEYMHGLQSPVVHRDVRSANVFVLSRIDLLKYKQRDRPNDIVVKLGDFGLSRYLTPYVSESLESWSWAVKKNAHAKKKNVIISLSLSLVGSRNSRQ